MIRRMLLVGTLVLTALWYMAGSASASTLAEVLHADQAAVNAESVMVSDENAVIAGDESYTTVADDADVLASYAHDAMQFTKPPHFTAAEWQHHQKSMQFLRRFAVLFARGSRGNSKWLDQAYPWLHKSNTEWNRWNKAVHRTDGGTTG